MLIINIVASVLLLAGPILGYHAAARRVDAERWQVIAWCTVGGAAAGVLTNSMMLLFELWEMNAGDLRGLVLPVAWQSTLFGLVFGFAAALTGEDSTRRLLTYALVMLGLMYLIHHANRVTSGLPADERASGVVLSPGDAPVPGAYVFLDRGGSGPLERLTTDAMGLFRAPLEPSGYRKAVFLICVPGGIPTVRRPLENAFGWVRVRIYPALPGADMEPGLRQQGWRKEIPSVCQGNLAERF